MAEQISRRANNVTSAGFDQPFETHIARFGVGGLNLKDSLDALEGWSRHTNVWHESEAEATGRPGQTAYATHGVGATCHSVRKLRDPQAGTTTRFWGIGGALHFGYSGATSSIDTGYSGNPLTLLPHRPTLSGDPWMFVADSNKMVKVKADGLVLPIGLPAPGSAPFSAVANEYAVRVCSVSAVDDTLWSSWQSAPGKDDNGHPTDIPIAAAADANPISGEPETAIYVISKSGATVDSAYDNWWGVEFPTERDLTTLSENGGSGTRPTNDNDICHFWAKLAQPEVVAEIRIYVVVSEVFDHELLPGTQPDPESVIEPGANTDAYVKAFRPNDFIQFVHARTSQVEAAEMARIYALRDKDSESRGYNDTRPSWEDDRARSDPARARSFQLGLGSHQWFGYGQVGSPFRRGDFQRIGNTTGRDWSTATGVILYVKMLGEEPQRITGIGFSDLYFTGGWGPDTVEPGAQMYDYKFTHYDPRTGAESNGSPEQTATDREDVALPAAAPIDSIRRQILIDPVAYGDGAIRQRFYRRGGSLIDDWYYCGENTSDGAVFTDSFADADVVTAGTLPVDHYQPVPTVTEDGTTVLAQPLAALWGPIEGMLLGCGDPYRPGYVYFSNPDAPDHWSSAGYTEVCAPSEELMNGGLLGHQAFVFSRLRLYFLYPALNGILTFTAAPGLCTRGLFARWAFCTGPGGAVYFVAEDGVFATNGGPEEWLSEAINPLFYGTEVNGYKPIDKSATHALRLTVWENDLFFQYQDTAGARQVMVYSLLQKFWRHYFFGKAPAVLQGEDEDVLLIGGRATGASYLHSGFSDDTLPIAATLRTGSVSGGKREEKLFGDVFLDANTNSTELALQVFLNEETHTNTTIPVAGAAVARQRFLIHAFGESPQKAHSIGFEVRWTSAADPPTLYQMGYAMTLQPDLTNTRVTNWDDLNSPDEVWLTGVTLDCDTGGQPKEINIERDFNGERTLVDTFTVTSNNRHKFKFSWLAVPAHMVRIRPEPGDCVPWLLYRADWIYVQEPPRISKWDIHFENQWDQYYTGLDLYCDTLGLEKRIEVFVDEVKLTNTLAGGITYWPITTNGRKVVHLTLPWGRGHIFRFRATDTNPGLLYTHRWHLQEEPSEQANWNQNFSILGTRADKWLKAVIFECDTFGQSKSVNVEVDGTVVETLTVNTTGRRVVQLALAQQALGRVWRMFPIDGNPGRLYTAEPLFDEEPFQLNRWETQETNHGLPGWFYPLYAHITVKSAADVTLTTVMQHNQVGGTTTRTYTIPATGSVKQRRFLHGFHAGKGVLIKYILTSAQPFWLYRDETTIAVQPWGAHQAVLVQPFGNDDLDPARPMSHAILNAQTSGGATQQSQAPQ